LTSVTIPEGVTQIGDYAFSGCTALTAVSFPNSLTHIWDYAFADCTGLTSLTFPENFQRLGAYAFENCTGLTSITCKAADPPYVQYNPFENVNEEIPVYVPCGAVEDYEWYWYINSSIDFENYVEIETLTPQNVQVAQEDGAFKINWQGEAASYQLYRNGALLETVTGTAYTDEGLSSGTEYCYTVKATGGTCESALSAEACLTFGGATGIAETGTDSGIRIYPNPVKDELRIATVGANGIRPENVEIVDLSGKTVISTSLNDRSINVSHLPAGIYLVKIETDKGTVTEKIVKE
jgi:hypothetical protein